MTLVNFALVVVLLTVDRKFVPTSRFRRSITRLLFRSTFTRVYTVYSFKRRTGFVEKKRSPPPVGGFAYTCTVRIRRDFVERTTDRRFVNPIITHSRSRFGFKRPIVVTIGNETRKRRFKYETNGHRRSDEI